MAVSRFVNSRRHSISNTPSSHLLLENKKNKNNIPVGKIVKKQSVGVYL